MHNLDKEEILEIAYKLYLQNDFKLTKVILNEANNLPGYNTLLRYGYSLKFLVEHCKTLSPPPEIQQLPNVCLNCSASIPRTNKFCNQSCAATFNNKSTKRKHSKICLWCLNERINKGAGRFCSRRCQVASKYCEYFLDWWNGENKPFNNRTVKGFLLVYNKYACSVCQIESWNGKPIVLELEHINGNSTDNGKENVCLLCPNCHSQTPTYKAKNVGNGRHTRRQRYRQGKSY